MKRTLALCLVVVASLAGCRTETPTTPTETPPLLLRWVVPADSTTGLADPDGIDFVVRFRRPIEAGEMPSLRMFPRPVSSGVPTQDASDAAQILWPAVVLDPQQPVHRLLIDGPTMRGPEILIYYPGQEATSRGVMRGAVEVSSGEFRAEDALVFALNEPGSGGGAPDYLGLVAATVVRPFDVVTRDRAIYRLSGLVAGANYLVFAIIDSDDDGRYEIDQDWWGYHRAGTVSDPVPLFVAAGSALDEPAGVDVTVHPPGTLDPDLGF